MTDRSVNDLNPVLPSTRGSFAVTVAAAAAGVPKECPRQFQQRFDYCKSAWFYKARSQYAIRREMYVGPLIFITSCYLSRLAHHTICLTLTCTVQDYNLSPYLFLSNFKIILDLEGSDNWTCIGNKEDL
jgi:hypothetical protein